MISAVTRIFAKWPARLNIAISLFFSIFFLYVLRANFSINILAMIEPTTLDEQGNLIELPDYGPRFAWNSYDQSLLLGAYFWGYAITSIPNGILTDKFGYAKANIGWVFFVCAILTALMPLAAESLTICLVLRFVLGFVSGGMVPCVNKIISTWSPPNERGKFMSTLFGTDIGTVITWSLCGVLIETVGWQWAFYVPAALIAAFVVVWYFVVFDTPAEHPRILPTERQYIEESLTGLRAGLKSWPPMWSIVKSLPFWSLLVLHYAHIWGMYFLITAAPKFMNEVLGFDLSASGFLASVPYLVRLVTGIGFGALGDYMRVRPSISQLWVRKGFCIMSHIMPGLFLLAIPYLGNGQPYVCIALITLSYGFNGAVTLTGYQNVHDLSPNYATTVYSIINGVATTSGFISPLVVGFFTAERNTIDEWSSIFVIGAAVYILPAVFFILFGSVAIQSWNEPRVSDDNNDRTETKVI